MFWFLYNFLFVVFMTVSLPGYLLHMWKRGGYRHGFMQRFGCYNRRSAPVGHDHNPRIWIHAVSVGEMLVALSFRDSLRKLYPDHDFVLTTNTSTAHRLASIRLQPGDALLYFPLDIPFFMRRAFDYINPGLILLMECELWPNMLREAKRRNIPVALANARLSDRSFAGYRRVKRLFAGLTGSISAVFAQTGRDADRFRRLGFPAERVHVAGNAKYDLSEPDEDACRRACAALEAAAIRPPALIVLGGSTWPGEEDVLLDMLPRLRQAVAAPVIMALAPRHAERCPAVLEAVKRRGLKVVTRRETQAHPVAETPDVLLVDTTGELQDFYTAAAVSFVGKSLKASGGQNPIEPAARGAAVIVGPHTGNFTEVVSDLRAAGGIIIVDDAHGLEREIADLLNHPERRDRLAERALQAVKNRRGAIDFTSRKIAQPIKSTLHTQ